MSVIYKLTLSRVIIEKFEDHYRMSQSIVKQGFSYYIQSLWNNSTSRLSRVKMYNSSMVQQKMHDSVIFNQIVNNIRHFGEFEVFETYLVFYFRDMKSINKPSRINVLEKPLFLKHRTSG